MFGLFKKREPEDKLSEVDSIRYFLYNNGFRRFKFLLHNENILSYRKDEFDIVLRKYVDGTVANLCVSNGIETTYMDITRGRDFLNWIVKQLRKIDYNETIHWVNVLETQEIRGLLEVLDKPIKLKEEIKLEELKVGDKVIAARDSVINRYSKGDIGIIDIVDGSSVPYRVQWDCGDFNWMCADNLKKYKSELKVGDRVRVTVSETARCRFPVEYFYMAGNTGTIVDEIKEKTRWFVKFDQDRIERNPQISYISESYGTDKSTWKVDKDKCELLEEIEMPIRNTLRYIRRDGKKVLQQLVNDVWSNVPIEKEEMGTVSQLSPDDKNQFKIGDRVRVLVSETSSHPYKYLFIKGNIGTIVGDLPGYYRVRFDARQADIYSTEGIEWSVGKDKVELVKALDEPKTYTLSEISKHLSNGCKFRRLGWCNLTFYFYVSERGKDIHCIGRSMANFSVEDIIANDWVLL